MRRIRPGRYAFGIGLAALLLSPAAALAQLNPERLNGTFDFQDKDELDKNTLEFQVELREFGVAGEVRDLAGNVIVTISYQTDFPSKASASEQSASVAQDRQVLVTLEVVDGITTVFDGQGAPVKCKVQAKIRDAEANDPDDPDKAQSTLTCDLGNDWDELEDGVAAPPSQQALDAVEAAFANRKDVKADTKKGKLQIKHNGVPVP